MTSAEEGFCKMSVVVNTAVCAPADTVLAENDDEVFDIFDKLGNPLGTELRGVVHAKGIWHRAVYCFVFNPRGEVLLQRRSAAKKIGPGQWDLSVAGDFDRQHPFFLP